MKTLEFKLSLNKSQQATIDRWLEAQRWVWNEGLRLLKEFEAFSHYNKHDKSHAPCCPINWEYRYIPNDKKDGYIAIPFSRIGFKPKYEQYQQSCPLPQYYRKPVLERDSEWSLRKLFAYKLHLDKPWLIECPYKVMEGTIKRLSVAWLEYRKGRRKSPRFKAKNEFSSLSNYSNGHGNGARVEGNRVLLTKLGFLCVKSVDRRWQEGATVKTYHIVKEPSGYYLFLVGEFMTPKLKASDKACGIDPGVAAVVTLDNGNQFKPANPLEKRLRKLRYLERKLARQKKGSNGWKRTKLLIAKLYEKTRRSRKAFNHKLSTKLVREYGAIAFEGTNLKNLSRKPNPKLSADGKKYEHNKAKSKAKLNRALMDAAIGQLRFFTEQKCKDWDREFTKTVAQNSSITCNHCGTVDKENRVSQSEFKCVSCGNIDHADGNAAKNHLKRGLEVFSRRYRSWEWELKRVENPMDSVKPEGVKASPMPEYGIQPFTSVQLTIWDVAIG